MASGAENSSTERSKCSAGNQETNAHQTLEDEISYLLTHFKGHCRVSDQEKRFVKVIKLHPENLDIVFNFKLTDSYPSTVPVIEIRSDSLDEDEMFDLSSFMVQTAESMSPVSMEALVNDAIGWLKEGRINVTGVRGGKKSQKDKAVGDTPRRTRAKKPKKKPTDKVDKGKKVPMRTAIDVVERIQWDPELHQDEFVVGYLDRMVGLQEKYFTAFSWEDIAAVDYTVLAIPKHRIQYFKYKNEIVWDKRCRLDNVFGSTGSGKTIRDVISKIDGHGENGVDEVAAADGGEKDEHVDSDYYDSEDSTESDTDSDDGITVTIGDGAYGGGRFSDDEEDIVKRGSDEEGGHDKYWRDKLRPNYFLALRITDEEVRKHVQEVQDYIVDNEARFKQCVIPNTALHITLCTVGLETPAQVQNAVDCLKEVKDELNSIIPKDKKLKFKGVDNFFNRVVYGKVIDCPPEFLEFVEHLKLCLIEKGVDIRDYHEFVPHMTLIKISRPFSRATGKKYVAPWLYSCFNQMDFGEQAVNNIHLCEMGDGRQEDGFYMSALSMEI